MKRRKKLARVLVLVLAVVIVAGAILFVLLHRQGLLLLPNEARPGRYEVWGVDVSSYQGEVDWPALRSQGVEFAFIKATEGSGSADAYFAQNWEDAQAAGVLAGAYHFFSYDSPGETQADNFITQVPVTAGALPPVVDVEFYGDKAQHPPQREAVKEILDPLLERLETRYGQKPILYVTYRTYELYIQGEYEDYPLWVTRPMLAPTDKDWSFWQYSHSARLEGYDGKEKHIDLNVFRGSREELEDMKAAEVPTYPDPITGFFRTLECEWSGTTLVTNVLAGLEMDAWKNEAEHIFEVLRETAYPGLAEYGLDLEQMEKDLQTYIEAQAELDAYMWFTDVLESRDGRICRGTGFPSGQYWAEGEHYRSFVTQMYDIFSFDHGAMTAADCYVFDPQEVLTTLESEGLSCAMGRYTVGRPETEEKSGDNPIDAWTHRYLDYDGTTIAMMEDANIQREIWEAELDHAYGLLLDWANPAAELESKVETAQTALLAFGPAYGRCVATYAYGGFFRESWEEEPEIGVPIGEMYWRSCTFEVAEYYRQETLALRQRLEDAPGRELTWAFDPEPYMERLETRYKSMYGEEYAKLFWPEEARP